MMRPLQNLGENAPFMEKSCLRLRFYLIEYPLKDFDEKGDNRGWDTRDLTAPRRNSYKEKIFIKSNEGNFK